MRKQKRHGLKVKLPAKKKLRGHQAAQKHEDADQAAKEHEDSDQAAEEPKQSEELATAPLNVMVSVENPSYSFRLG